MLAILPVYLVLACNAADWLWISAGFAQPGVQAPEGGLPVIPRSLT